MIKLSDELYIPPMGQVLAERDKMRAAEAAKKWEVARSYAAAQSNRLNAGWTSHSTASNYEIRCSLQALRARAREAARNNGHIKNFLNLMRTNVIGSKGIQMQPRARLFDGKTLNTRLNKQIEERWFEWGHRENCTVSGKLDWIGVQNLVLTQLMRDGEFLVQMIEDVGDFGLSLKVWDVNWLDETFNENRPGVNRIIMSVEIDDNDRPVAYWLTPPPSEDTYLPAGQTRRRRRVPAEEMIHGFLVSEDESQVRGVTWLAATLLNLKHFQGYVEGVVTQARVAAHTFGLLKNTSPTGEQQFEGEEDAEGNMIHPFIESSPLSITAMLPGWELQQFDPKQPTQNHPEFARSMQTSIGTDLSIPYFLLVGDWTAVNFSSSRGGLNEYRDLCEGLQTFIAQVLCRPVAHKFFRQAWLTGKIELSARNFAELQNPTWRPRGWDYIDPSKDIVTDEKKLLNRLATPSEILAERGVDYIDHLERWKSDRDLAAEYGIDIEDIYSDAKAAAPAAAPAKEPDDDEEDPQKTPQDDGERAYTNGRYTN